MWMLSLVGRQRYDSSILVCSDASSALLIMPCLQQGCVTDLLCCFNTTTLRIHPVTIRCIIQNSWACRYMFACFWQHSGNCWLGADQEGKQYSQALCQSMHACLSVIHKEVSYEAQNWVSVHRDPCPSVRLQASLACWGSEHAQGQLRLEKVMQGYNPLMYLTWNTDEREFWETVTETAGACLES